MSGRDFVLIHNPPAVFEYPGQRGEFGAQGTEWVEVRQNRGVRSGRERTLLR